MQKNCVIFEEEKTVSFVNECEQLDQIIDHMKPFFEQRLIRRKDVKEQFGFAEDHLDYIESSGRRDGWDSAMWWLIDSTNQLYLYFGRYISMGPEDKSPFVEVGLVFWRDKVFHFHFHEIYTLDKFIKNKAGFSSQFIDSDLDFFREVRWVVFLIDYVSGWDGLDCKEELAKKMIRKIARSIHTISPRYNKGKCLNTGVYYISGRLKRESDFERNFKSS